MSGGKGGSSSTEIPEWLKDPLLRNITRAEAIQSQEYTPWQGADVAAFSPMQVQAMRNVGGAAEAFGMMPMGQGQQYVDAGINAPQTFAGGIRGYSSMPLYEQAMAKTAATPEGQANLAIRKEIYSPDVASLSVNRFRKQLGLPAKGEAAQQSSSTFNPNGGQIAAMRAFGIYGNEDTGEYSQADWDTYQRRLNS